MEQKAMGRFFTLKGLNPEDIHAGLYESMGPMYSFCEHSINGTSVSLNKERSFSMICDLSDPSRMISPKSFALCFRNVLLLYATDFVTTSELRRLRACIYCTTFCCYKVQFTLDSAHSRQRSKDRTGFIFFGTARNSDEPGTEKVRSSYNRQRIVVYFEYPCAAV
jgi:hypothetical protein